MGGGGGTHTATRSAGREQRGSAPTPTDLWCDVLQRVCSRAAHALKGSLNGVSVNLEVVRSRSDKPDAAASAVNSFATAASIQLDDVISMTEALLAIARAAREPVDLATIVRQTGALLTPPARSEGRRFEIEPGLDVLGRTTVSAPIARLSIVAAMLAASDASADVRCSASSTGDASQLRLIALDGARLALRPELAAAAADGGIEVAADADTITLQFPR